MKELLIFLETYWWLIPLAMVALCVLAGRDGSVCCGMWDGRQSDHSPLDILDRRYASGDIGSMEYGEKVLTMGLKTRK